MKKKLILTLFLLVITNLIYSQKGIIYYGYIEAFTIGNAKGPDSNAFMTFDKNMSHYVTAKDSLEKADKINEQKTYKKDEDSGGAIHNGMKVSKEGDQVVYHIKKNTMWSNLLYGKQVYVKEVVDKINWKISKDTKKIGKFNCKKATAKFRGRNYTAWFTTEIPVSFGPWKLHGLPGLILEAYDTNKNVYWYFKNIEYPTKNKETVKYLEIPKVEKFLTYSDFKKFQHNEQELVIEKSKILQKKFPEVEMQLEKPELSIMFIECE